MTDNLSFLAEVFGANWEQAHICTIPGNPYDADPRRWGGGHARDLIDQATDDQNNYFTISIFEGTRRAKSDFDACHLIVIDDVGMGESAHIPPGRVLDVLPEPSYKIETSPSNEQWGYLLDPPCPTRWQVERLQQGLVALGLAKADGSDAGMMGVTRYGRLPCAINGKPGYANGEGPFKVALTEWNPDEKWSLGELADLAELDLGEAPKEAAAKIDPMEDDPFVVWAQRLGIAHGWRDSPDGRQHIVTCPLVHEHTDGVDNGFYYLSPGMFFCHHGSHIESKEQGDWWSEYAKLCPSVLDELREYIDGHTPWPTVVPLISPMPCGPPFPVESIPGVLADFVAAVSEAVQVPSDMVAGLALAACATAIQGRFEIELQPGYTEQANLFVTTIAAPGARKTAVFKAASAPIHEEEGMQREAARLGIMKNRQRLKTHMKRISKLEAKLGGDDHENVAADLLDLTEETATLQDQQLHMPTITVSDITPEELGNQMHEQGGKIALWNPEGGDMFDIAGGRYSSDGKGNFGIFLAGHANDHFRVHRRNGDPIEIEEAILSVGTTLQPDVIANLSESSAFRGRGLLGRFCWVFPKAWVGHREVDVEGLPARVKDAYRDLVMGLFHLNNTADRERIKLHPKALESWKDFFRWLEPTLDPSSGRYRHMADWAGKLCGLVGRLALVLHCAEAVRGRTKPSTFISLDTMKRAEQIGHWLLVHAEVTYKYIDGHKDSQPEIRVWRMMLKHADMDGISEHQKVWQSVKGNRGLSGPQMKESCDLLVEKGYIRKAVGDDRKVWEINPTAVEEWIQESAN